MENNREKENRLTKKQAIFLIVIGMLVDLPIRNMSNSNLVTMAIGAMAETVYIYAFISLFTKKGLRWK